MAYGLKASSCDPLTKNNKNDLPENVYSSEYKLLISLQYYKQATQK